MKPTVSYSAPRLRFYADIIEPLAMNAVIEIISPDATWLMTKADFYRVFPNVVASKSYLKAALGNDNTARALNPAGG